MGPQSWEICYMQLWYPLYPARILKKNSFSLPAGIAASPKGHNFSLYSSLPHLLSNFQMFPSLENHDTASISVVYTSF